MKSKMIMEAAIPHPLYQKAKGSSQGLTIFKEQFHPGLLARATSLWCIN